MLNLNSNYLIKKNSSPIFYEYRGFERDLTMPDPDIACASLSLFAINFLNESRNQSIHEINLIKNLKDLAIEIGLFLSTAILAPIEAVLRISLAIIFSTFAYTAYKVDQKNHFSEKVYTYLFLGALLSAFSLAHGSISLYTNIAYINQAIDYNGQISHFLLRHPPMDLADHLHQTT